MKICIRATNSWDDVVRIRNQLSHLTDISESDIKFKSESTVVFVAYMGTDPVGYVSAQCDFVLHKAVDNFLEVTMSTYVVPEYQSRGVGTSLLEHLEQYLSSETDVTKIRAGGAMSNLGARDRLLRSGFSKELENSRTWVVTKAVRQVLTPN